MLNFSSEQERDLQVPKTVYLIAKLDDKDSKYSLTEVYGGYREDEKLQRTSIATPRPFLSFLMDRLH